MPRLISGHISCGVPERLMGGAYRWITILRNQFNKNVSNYLYDRDYYFSSSLSHDLTNKNLIFSKSPRDYVYE